MSGLLLNMNFAFINNYNKGLRKNKRQFYIVYKLRHIKIEKYEPTICTIYE